MRQVRMTASLWVGRLTLWIRGLLGRAVPILIAGGRATHKEAVIRTYEEQDHEALGSAWHTSRCSAHQRTKWTYIFGAICPARGEAIGLILPWCNTEVMNAHLAEISAAVAPGAHAVLIMDQAGWHTTAKLRLPANITILPLTEKAPELNPVENIWQFMRDNWLSNRIFECHDQIVALCREACNRLRDQPWRVMSIGLRDWAHA